MCVCVSVRLNTIENPHNKHTRQKFLIFFRCCCCFTKLLLANIIKYSLTWLFFVRLSPFSLTFCECLNCCAQNKISQRKCFVFNFLYVLITYSLVTTHLIKCNRPKSHVAFPLILLLDDVDGFPFVRRQYEKFFSIRKQRTTHTHRNLNVCETQPNQIAILLFLWCYSSCAKCYIVVKYT